MEILYKELCRRQLKDKRRMKQVIESRENCIAALETEIKRLRLSNIALDGVVKTSAKEIERLEVGNKIYGDMVDKLQSQLKFMLDHAEQWFPSGSDQEE